MDKKVKRRLFKLFVSGGIGAIVFGSGVIFLDIKNPFVYDNVKRYDYVSDTSLDNDDVEVFKQTKEENIEDIAWLLYSLGMGNLVLISMNYLDFVNGSTLKRVRKR